MADLEMCLLIALACAAPVAVVSLVWVRAGRRAWRPRWARGLFVAIFLGLGATTVLAAVHYADSLVPLGLSAGALLVGFLWEGPGRRWQVASPAPEEM